MSGNTPLTSALKTILARTRTEAAMHQAHRRTTTMPRNTTVPTEISPAQALALEALLPAICRGFGRRRRGGPHNASPLAPGRSSLHRGVSDRSRGDGRRHPASACRAGTRGRDITPREPDRGDPCRYPSPRHPGLTQDAASGLPDECSATSAREASIAIRQRQGDTKMKELIASLNE